MTTIHPSAAQLHELQRRRLTVAGPVALVLVVGNSLVLVRGSGLPSALLALTIGLAVLAVILIWQWLYLRRALIRTLDSRVEILGAFGPAHTIARSGIAGLDPVVVTWRLAGQKTYYILHGEGGRCLARFDEALWSADAMSRLRRALGLLEGHFARVTARELGAKYPGAMSFWHRHIWLTESLIAVVVVGLIVAWTDLQVVLSH